MDHYSTYAAFIYHPFLHSLPSKIRYETHKKFHFFFSLSFEQGLSVPHSPTYFKLIKYFYRPELHFNIVYSYPVTYASSLTRTMIIISEITMATYHLHALSPATSISCTLAITYILLYIKVLLVITPLTYLHFSFGR